MCEKTIRRVLYACVFMHSAICIQPGTSVEQYLRLAKWKKQIEGDISKPISYQSQYCDVTATTGHRNGTENALALTRIQLKHSSVLDCFNM